MISKRYCASPYFYQRRKTRQVIVGNPAKGGVIIGGDHPIVVQSMITADTMDTAACVRETLELVKVGCQLVRITAPTVKDAANLKNIVADLRAQGCWTPIVADIHFKPEAALEAAQWVEKIRVNPGNYADSKKFAVKEYSDHEYAMELARLEDRFAPLVKLCTQLGRALRIGVNHGSLSDRIMNRYGDTPTGMVESALEFARIARRHGFHNFCFSMKASNPKVVIECCRLLAARLEELGPDWNYPLHLGVTEAGEGEDGRIKSAIGIGSLLADGLGDTIRVSLTEDSPNEIPVCRDLIAEAGRAALPLPIGWGEGRGEGLLQPEGLPESSRRSESAETSGRGVVKPLHPEGVPELGHHVEPSYDPFVYERRSTREIALGPNLNCGGQQPVRVVVSRAAMARLALQIRPQDNVLPEAVYEELKVREIDPAGKFELPREDELVTVKDDITLPPLAAFRLLAAKLKQMGKNNPMLLKVTACPPAAMLRASLIVGALLADGIGDALFLSLEPDPALSLRLSFNILQAAGCRSFKTDYVACPSCGRTLFNLQTVTARIKSRTQHLKGVKIAIMGCIVNGPGEMADADFGYVGGAPGKVNLYVGKKPVKFNIPEADAVDRLVDLIREHGKWVEPEG